MFSFGSLKLVFESFVSFAAVAVAVAGDGGVGGGGGGVVVQHEQHDPICFFFLASSITPVSFPSFLP